MCSEEETVSPQLKQKLQSLVGIQVNRHTSPCSRLGEILHPTAMFTSGNGADDKPHLAP